MSLKRLDLNLAAFREIRTSPAVMADVTSRARSIAASAGEGHMVDSEITGGRGRARAVVYTATYEAMSKEATDQNLTRSIDAGR